MHANNGTLFPYLLAVIEDAQVDQVELIAELLLLLCGLVAEGVTAWQR